MTSCIMAAGVTGRPSTSFQEFQVAALGMGNVRCGLHSQNPVGVEDEGTGWEACEGLTRVMLPSGKTEEAAVRLLHHLICSISNCVCKHQTSGTIISHWPSVSNTLSLERKCFLFIVLNRQPHENSSGSESQAVLFSGHASPYKLVLENLMEIVTEVSRYRLSVIFGSTLKQERGRFPEQESPRNKQIVPLWLRCLPWQQQRCKRGSENTSSLTKIRAVLLKRSHVLTLC